MEFWQLQMIFGELPWWLLAWTAVGLVLMASGIYIICRWVWRMWR